MPILQTYDDITKDHPQKGKDGGAFVYTAGYDNTAFVEPLNIGTSRDTTRSRFHATGWADSIPNTRVDIWYNGTGTPTTYVYPTTGIQMQVISTSTEDGVGGTGIRTLNIDYLTTGFVEKTIQVVTAGTTASLTSASDIYRVQAFYTNDTNTGTNKAAVGNILLQAVGGGVTYAGIEASWNKANLVLFTVPVNKNLFIKHWSFSTGAATGSHFTKLWLRTTCDHDMLVSNGVFHFHSVGGSLNSSTEFDFDIPHRFPTGTDVKVSVQADSGTVVGASSELIGWLEPT